MASNMLSDVFGDGKLLKELCREGGEHSCQPRAGESVTVLYVCRVGGSSGEVVDSSRDRNESLTFTIGKGEALLGLDHAVATMRQGELARFTVHPDLAFGAAGCGGIVPPSPPAEAEAAMIYCELELMAINTGAAECEEDYAEHSAEERLEIAMRTKDQGNTYFKTGDLDRALSSYSSALTALGLPADGKEPDGDDAPAYKQQQDRMWAFDLHRETRGKLAVSCYLNASQCFLRVPNNTAAFQQASAALGFEPSNAKALFRRGTAAMGLGLFDRARSDLAEAVRQEPRNAEIRAQLQSCQQQAQSAETKVRNTFGGMFDRAKQSKIS